MHRRSFVLASAAAVAGCSRRAAPVRRKLTVSAARQLSMSSLYLAQELGYFRDAGLDVQIELSTNPLQAVAAMAGGKLDVLFTALSTSFLNAMLKGARLRIVAGREIASPVCGGTGVICGLRRTFPKGLEDLRQLKGRRVVTGPSIGMAQFSLEAQLRTVGMSLSDVTPVTLPAAQAVAALIGGSVDAIVLNVEMDANISALSAEMVRFGGLAHVYPDFQISYILFGQSLLDSDLDTGARFLAAYLRGAREFAHGGTPKFMVDYATGNGLDVQRVTGACRETFTLDGEVNVASLSMFAEWAATRKYTPDLLDMRQMVDLRFLRRAREL